MMFTKELIVTKDLTNDVHEISLEGLSRILEKVVHEHLFDLGHGYEEMKNRGLMWIIVNRHAEITRLPHEDETMIVKTGIGKMRAGLYPRKTTVYDEKGTVLLREASYWAPVSFVTRKLATGNDILLPAEDHMENEYGLPGWAFKMADPDKISLRTVHEENIDNNMHMNNADYFKWAESIIRESYPGYICPKGFHIMFIRELRLDDKAELKYGVRDNTFFMTGYSKGNEILKLSISY